jgi:hypothetical protein
LQPGLVRITKYLSALWKCLPSNESSLQRKRVKSAGRHRLESLLDWGIAGLQNQAQFALPGEAIHHPQ